MSCPCMFVPFQIFEKILMETKQNVHLCLYILNFLRQFRFTKQNVCVRLYTFSNLYDNLDLQK